MQIMRPHHWIKNIFVFAAHLFTIAKNAGIGIGGRLFFIIVRFCITLLITRTIGPEQYGVFVLAMSIITFVELFALMGFEPAMVKFVAQYKAQKNISMIRGLIAFGLGVSLVASLIWVIGIFLSSELLADMVFHKINMAPVLRVMLLGIPFVSVMVILLSALQGAKLVKYKILVQQVLMPIFRWISIYVFFLFGYRLMGIAWTWVITSMFGFVMAVIFLTKKIGYVFKRPIVMEKKKIISFSLPLLFNKFFYQNINIFGILIIGMFLPSSQVGIYGVAIRVLPFFLIPLVSYNAIFSPTISELFTKGKMKELGKIYKKGSMWLVSIAFPLFVLIVFFSEQIASIFGPDFSESAQLMSVLLIGQVISSSAGSPGFILVMTGNVVYEMVNSVLLCLLNIVLTLFLISKYGLIGVAWAYSFSIAIVRLIQLLEVWYLYRINPYSMEHLKPVISAILSFTIMYLLSNSFVGKDNIVSVFGLIFIFSIAYITFYLLFGVSDEDRMLIMHLRQKFNLFKRA